MAIYTPGPWMLQDCSNGGMILLRPPLPGQKHAVQSHLQILPQADARLIAAAPELLEACKEMLNEFPSECSCDEAYTSREKALGYRFKDPDCMYCEYDDVIAKLKAAIAKAEGRRDE